MRDEHNLPPLPSKVFARRVFEVRKRRGWSQAQLAARITELGHPIDQATVARIEKGREKPSTRTRNVTLDEAFVFGAALGVAPIYLFLPRERDEQVSISREITVDSSRAQDWLVGTLRLREGDDLGVFLSERNREALYALLAADAEPRIRAARRARLEEQRKRSLATRQKEFDTVDVSPSLRADFARIQKADSEMDIEDWASLYGINQEGEEEEEA